MLSLQLALLKVPLQLKNNIIASQIDLSEQQIVDCTNGGTYGNSGCMGGSIYNTLLYSLNLGLMNEVDYKYTSGIDGIAKTCFYDANKLKTKVTSFYQLNYANTDEIIAALKQKPLIAHIYVASDFYFYSKGIYSSSLCNAATSASCGIVNHGVLITGYGIENNVEYFIAKNSWGSGWGEKGFFRIKARENTCCIEAFEFSVSV